MSIPSFDLSFISAIDSLNKANRASILSMNNLIIDIRNNGGGGFDAFMPILPYVLDQNITEPPYYGSVWVSKGNFEYYDRTKFEFAETKQDSILELAYIQFLSRHIGTFAPVILTRDTIQLEGNAPNNIAILFNKNTASSAEGFVLKASNSKKVRTFGENSAGAVSYGDWRRLELHELKIWVAITTKKVIFSGLEDFETIGISPDINLSHSNEEEWLQMILDEMER